MHWSRRITDYVLVTLITLMIWVYAEGQNVKLYQPTERVPLNVKLNADDLVVVSQSVSSVGVEFSGATAEVDKLRPLLNKQGLTFAPDITEPGEKSYFLRDVLYQADPVDQASVNINFVDPPGLTVVVDRLVKRDVPLVFAPTDVKLVEGSVKIEPATVTLTAPQRLLDQAGLRDGSFTLSLEPLTPLKGLAPGVEHRSVEARVKLPIALAGDQHVSIEPNKPVRVSFSIDKAEDRLTMPSVPVWILAPPDALKEYAVRLHEDDRVLRDVKVSGPANLIAQLRGGKIKVLAVLRLNSDQLSEAAGKGDVTGAVSIEAEAGLTVEVDSRSVRYTVTRSGAAPTAAP